MPKSRETKAALEVNAGMVCLAGVAVLSHCYVAVPLIFLISLLRSPVFRRPFFLPIYQRSKLDTTSPASTVHSLWLYQIRLL